MTPDDWQKGMENEAASVEDDVWALETQQVITQGKRHRFLLDSLVCLGAATILAVLWMTMQVLLLRAAVHMDSNPVGVWVDVNRVRVDLVTLALLSTTGLLLGALGVRPLQLAPFFALMPILLWIIGLTVQSEGMWSGTATTPMTPYTADFAFFQLRPGHLVFSAGAALVGFLTAWVGQRLRRRHRRTLT